MQTSVLYSKSQHSRGTSKDPDECDESAPGASAGLKHKCCLLKGWVIKRQDKRKLWRVGGAGGGGCCRARCAFCWRGSDV